MIPISAAVVSGVALSNIGGQTKMALMKRSKEGFWCHVAGKIEDGETGWQAIIREFFEETQIVVRELYSAEYLEQFYVASDNRIDVVPAFVVFCPPEQKIMLNAEHTEYRWCTLDEAMGLVPYPNQKKLYEHIWRYFVLEAPSDFLKVDLV